MITFAEKSLSDFGVSVFRVDTDTAPAREHDMIPVQGRSGDLFFDRKRYPNQSVSYYVFCVGQNAEQHCSDAKNFLLSQVGYKRLEDTDFPDEYRMACVSEKIAPVITRNRDMFKFQIEFNCKPQRFLKSGQEVTTFEAGAGETETYSGEIVTFDNPGDAEITSLSVAVEPVQDLHGQASPWPAGGGKNKFNSAWLSDIGVAHGTISINQNGSVTLTATANDCYTQHGASFWSEAYRIPVSQGDVVRLTWSVNGAAGQCGIFPNGTSSGFVLVDNTAGIASLTVGAGTSFVTMRLGVTSSGNTATYSNVMVTVNNSDTSFAPYENLCPISGWDSVGIEAAGINVWDEELEFGYIYNGTPYSSNDYKRSKNFVPVVPGATYYLCGFANDGQLNFFDKAKAYKLATNFPSNRTFTVPDGCYFIKFYNSTSAYDTPHSINYPSTDHDYHAYTGNTYTITLGQTVYGGTLDAVNGTMTVDRAMFAWTSTSGGYLSTTNAYFLNKSDVIKIDTTNQTTLIGAICDKLKSATWADIATNTNEYLAGCVYGNGLAFRIPGFTTASEYTAWLADNPLTFVYLLKTPFEIQLDPVTISTISGQTNNVWSDAGDVTVEVFIPEKPAVTNPTLFSSQPLMRVYGAGALGVGSQTITITQADEYTDIDCELMDCFKGLSNKNIYVQLTDYNFPVLPPGITNFSLGTGITRLEVTPRWWKL